MPVKTHGWISLWIAATIPLIFWDASYCFMRPRSFEGGDLHHFWSPYKIFQNVDLVYGVEAHKRGDGFANAQSLMRIVKNLLNILYLYLAHVVEWPAANLIAFTAAVMTSAKTILYWAQEYYCNYCMVGHNKWFDLIFFWIIPTGLWIVVPTAIVYVLGNELVHDLTVASKVQVAAANGNAKSQ